mmetsp:Transcript_31735/g.57458  ORF Transcript_31735/g.57458 Transcript_31735/m.57458 type:complete len:96 (+) Transcript_31735:170-457(+)
MRIIAMNIPNTSHSLLSFNKRTTNSPNPYPVIRNKIPELVKALLDLPDCPVWIHEKQLCRIIKMPSGNTFGQQHSLSCLLGMHGERILRHQRGVQ